MNDAGKTGETMYARIKERLQRANRRQWVKFLIASVCYIAFICWVGNFWWLLLLPVIADAYLTRFFPWGFWRKSKNEYFRKTMEWVDAIVYALVAVYFINTFFFQNYKIPSSSLEKSLLVGDYLFVSKMSYGPRVPNTPLSFPLAQHTLPILNVKSYIEWPQWGYKRLKGLGKIQRNDIVVFNFPAGDTVTLNVSNPDYYTLVAEYGRDMIEMNKRQLGDIVYRPVDRRENYVKRAVGLPGDWIELRNNDLYVNGERAKDPKNLEHYYYLMTQGNALTEEQFRLLNISVEDREWINPNNGGVIPSQIEELGFLRNANNGFNPIYRVPLTAQALETARKSGFVAAVFAEPGSWSYGVGYYPLGNRFGWTRSDYGPIWIPKKGETITLTEENFPIYERVIRDYERNKLEKRNGKYYINDQETDQYTFQMDYYWMMGDNRDNSADSRSWGFVPEDHIVGKPLFVWLSIDKDRGWFDGRIRFDRIFKKVTRE